jgi:starvation-inducible DNA-binding protein
MIIMNEQLINFLKECTADAVALKFKAHGYHWNVEGDDFPQWHDKLGDIYDELDGAIDTFAEWIRMVDVNAYAPFKLSRYAELTTIPETDVSSDPMVMIADLCNSFDIAIAKYIAGFDLATTTKQNGLANFFADRQTALQKWCWQLRASLKNVEND